ncbi:MAG: arsenate reductase ArsC [Candidatus Kapaibacterium sp.]
MMYRILFICAHNSARSQMAEALLRRETGGAIRVESAGLEYGPLHPHAAQVLKEVGIEISGNQSHDVFEKYKAGEHFSHVITVCDISRERAPIFPGIAQHLHWDLPDPASFTGTEEEQLTQTRLVRDMIQQKVIEWCKENDIVDV